MSVFAQCERALGLIRGNRLTGLSASDRGMLEALDAEGLAATHAQDEAVRCAVHFGPVRDRLLRLHPWTFARKGAALARMAPSSSLPAGWGHAFALPGDCLRPLALVATGKGDRGSVLTRWEVADGKLLCDVETVHLRYTARVVDTGRWDPAFADAFCASLAGELAAAVTGQAANIQLMEQRAQLAVQDGYRTGAIKAETGLPVRMGAWMDYSGIPTGPWDGGWA
ncbi:MAG: hypothetical protein IJR14_07530 [Synergistaceae bacterium]|nr:hypothetical protein [Synergistaceae bacterium]